jgi:hypothetical protein
MDPQNQTPPPQTPVQTPPEAPQVVPSKSFPLKWILILIIFILIGGGATYYVANQSQKPASSSNQTPTTAPSPTPTPDPTSDWKTYTNTKYGYSVKYPSDWKIQSPGGGSNGELCRETGIDSQIIELSEKELSECGFAGEGLPSPDANITVWVLDEKHSTLENLIGPNYSKLQVAGEAAVKYPFTDESALPNIYATRIYLNHNNNGYIIYLKQSDITGKYEMILDQILSTFKFTEASTSASPTP